MANRFFNPDEQFCDSTGLPYAGGSLAFYASGTSTPLNTYSDSALSIANTNPVVLDSAGRANSIFLQNLAYKVVLSDVNSNVIWTFDPVFSSDYSSRAKLTSGSGSPNGSVAGTAGSAGIGADVYWDNTNNILYVCTTTGNAAAAVWTAVNSTSAAAIVSPPQGYLTPTSGTPIITSDVVANTSLVYTPYVGNLVPVYSGTGFVPTVFSELTLTLTSSQALNTIYDVFVFNNSGVLTLVTGPGWSVSTAGSGARGTGAGTTQLSRLSGIYVNTVQITGRNSSNSYTIPANQATYLGSISIDGTAGQITLHRSYGQSRKWAIWNAYNRTSITLLTGDSTASWTPSGGTFNNTNSNAANSATVFTGLPYDAVYSVYTQVGTVSYANNTAGMTNGIGLNNTTGAGSTGSVSVGNTTTSGSGIGNAISTYLLLPTIGINKLNLLEARANTATNAGTINNCLMTSTWLG